MVFARPLMTLAAPVREADLRHRRGTPRDLPQETLSTRTKCVYSERAAVGTSALTESQGVALWCCPLFLRDILTSVPSQYFVDEGLVSDAAATCFLAEPIEHSRIDANRDQLARYVAKRRPAEAPHRLQLRLR